MACKIGAFGKEETEISLTTKGNEYLKPQLPEFGGLHIPKGHYISGLSSIRPPRQQLPARLAEGAGGRRALPHHLESGCLQLCPQLVRAADRHSPAPGAALSKMTTAVINSAFSS